MNINTDNYEAYLLDYQEGNLNESEARQLKEFVLAQGLDWDELTEELPKLGVPNLVYENKEALKKRTKKVPLFVQIVFKHTHRCVVISFFFIPSFHIVI